MFLMQRLVFVVVVVLSICTQFLYFVKDRGLRKAPDCKSFNEALVILVMY